MYNKVQSLCVKHFSKWTTPWAAWKQCVHTQVLIKKLQNHKTLGGERVASRGANWAMGNICIMGKGV